MLQRLTHDQMVQRLRAMQEETARRLVPQDVADEILRGVPQRLRRSIKPVPYFMQGEIDRVLEEWEEQQSPGDLLNRSQAAKRLGCHVETVSRMINDHRLQPTLVKGRRPYFSREQVDRARKLTVCGPRMNWTEAARALHLRPSHLSSLQAAGLLPPDSRAGLFRSADIYSFAEAVNNNPDAPFGDRTKDELFRVTMAALAKADAAWEARLLEGIARAPDPAEAERRRCFLAAQIIVR